MIEEAAVFCAGLVGFMGIVGSPIIAAHIVNSKERRHEMRTLRGAMLADVHKVADHVREVSKMLSDGDTFQMSRRFRTARGQSLVIHKFVKEHGFMVHIGSHVSGCGHSEGLLRGIGRLPIFVPVRYAD